MAEAHDIFFVPEQFLTIQAAVDAIQHPTTIMVSPGAYDESVVIRDKEYVVIQSVRLTRRGVALTGQDGCSVVLVERSTLHLSGIEVRSDGRMRGIWAGNSRLSLQDCVIAGNRIGVRAGGMEAHVFAATGCDPADSSRFGAGMFFRRTSVRIQKSAIIGNTICWDAAETFGESGDDLRRAAAIGPDQPDASATEARGGGLYFEDCSIEIAGSTIQANAVYCNWKARGGGIWCERSRMRMWRSRVTDNALYAPIGGGAGIYFKDPSAVELGGSVISGNGTIDGKGGGIYVEGDATKVRQHRNTVVNQNYPDDLYFFTDTAK